MDGGQQPSPNNTNGERTLKLYLAGPMRGYPEFNFPAFHAAAKQLRSLGHEVFSPADHDILVCGGDEALARSGASPVTIRSALATDLAWICNEADGIALLRGWAHSKGAAAELATARAIGIDAIFQQHNGEFA